MVLLCRSDQNTEHNTQVQCFILKSYYTVVIQSLEWKAGLDARAKQEDNFVKKMQTLVGLLNYLTEIVTLHLQHTVQSLEPQRTLYGDFDTAVSNVVTQAVQNECVQMP